MAEPMSGPITRCPWCSAELPVPEVEHCPSCGATLTSTSGTEPQLPGVTTLDAEAIIRARADVARPRNRILSFITGDVVPETAPDMSPESLAPPSDDVKREMLRLQLEAEIADLEAETVALKSDVVVEQGIHLGPIDDEATATAPAAGAATAPTAAATPATDPAGAPNAAPAAGAGPADDRAAPPTAPPA